MIEIEGTVEEIIFTNDINGYTICGIKSGKKTMVAVGYMPFVNIGEDLKITGSWVNHPDYGEQFKVDLYEKILPQTAEAIEKYLASGIIKGVGPVTAARLVEAFGEDTLNVISLKPQMLSEIKGISLDKALRIGQALDEQKGLRNIILFLQNYGISPSCCIKIYRIYSDKAVEKIKENPYCLAEEVFGIGFKTADRIAMSLGIDPMSIFRVRSGIKYILSRAAADGHTYMPAPKLEIFASELLQAEISNIRDALISLIMEKAIIQEKIDDTDRIYLSPFYYAELGVSRRLAELAGTHFVAPPEFDNKLEGIQLKEGITLNPMQRKAVYEAVSSGTLVITGGPGTGKTTIIKSIISILAGEGLRVMLAAPTGRAAKRMSEATGFEARTIHRMLETGYIGDNRELLFQRNEESPVDADVIIVDEMSMVDILLMNHMLKAVPTGARLILVGDVNQLPSVGAGNVLEDIIRSGLVMTVRLNEIFRQARESMIIVNAHRINKGEMPYLNVKDKDFFFVARKNIENIVSTLVDLCCRRLPETYGYDPLRHIQVLSPAKKGPAGVLNLNVELQKVLNPAVKDKCEKASRDFTFREGDRIMQMKNNYNLRWEKYGQADIDGAGVFNGDIGIIRTICDEDRMVEVLFDDDRIVEYDYGILDEIGPAYAVTIHKSQGSEFPAVVIPVFPGPQVLMTRNLLYTAVTRAIDMVVLVGDVESLGKMIANEREIFRYSGLANKIRFAHGLN